MPSAAAVEGGADAIRDPDSFFLVSDDAVDRWSPRALPDACRAQLRHAPQHFLARTRRERAALHRRKPPARDRLDRGQRAAEAGEIALGERGQQRHENEMSDLL